jgi:hypothetical protein
MELESGSRAVSVGALEGRRRVSGGGQWVTWAAWGIAEPGQRLARRPRTHDPRHVSDHVDEEAGRDEDAWRS